MLNISKENFCKALNTITDYLQEVEEFSNALEKFTGGFCYFELGDDLMMNYIHLLETLVKDEPDKYDQTTIEWWLFENVDKVIYIENEKFDVKTPESLYDYFCHCDSLEEV